MAFSWQRLTLWCDVIQSNFAFRVCMDLHLHGLHVLAMNFLWPISFSSSATVPYFAKVADRVLARSWTSRNVDYSANIIFLFNDIICDGCRLYSAVFVDRSWRSVMTGRMTQVARKRQISVTWSETVGLRTRPVWNQRKSVLVLVLHTAVLVLQFWCCFVKHDLVTLVVIMIFKDTLQLFKYYL